MKRKKEAGSVPQTRLEEEDHTQQGAAVGSEEDAGDWAPNSSQRGKERKGSKWVPGARAWL